MQGIYAIVNTANGRRYIGSSADLARRWKVHRKDLERGTHANVHLEVRARIAASLTGIRQEIAS